MNRINSIVNITGEKISELKKIAIESTKIKQMGEKKLSLVQQWFIKKKNFKQVNMYLIKPHK